MEGFEYRDGALLCGEVPVAAIAQELGTPLFLYSAQGIRAAYRRLERAFSPLRARIHYAVKASSNIHLLRLLQQLGAGMDVVSGGELERAWLAGAPMGDILFAGVGKTDSEIRAALDGQHSPLAGEAASLGREGIGERGPVGLFNAESASELERIAAIAGTLGVRARACVRINPDVDPHTHRHTTTGKRENKFGIDVAQVPALFDRYRAHPSLDLVGLHVHIGSPVRQVGPFELAIRALLRLADELEEAGHLIGHLDLGGGWAVDYEDGEAPPIEAYADALIPLLAERVERGVEISIEPGRSIVANAGVLVTRVHHVKAGRTTHFLVCDSGMHNLIRPAFYEAFHFVWPVDPGAALEPPGRQREIELPGLVESTVVGPICESSDFLARDRPLPPVERGDLLAIFSAGAYGMSMASNYNDHGRPAEVMVDGSEVTVVNERQSLGWQLETERKPRRLQLEVPPAGIRSC